MDKRDVVRHELEFLLSHPECLENITTYLANLTPEQVEAKIKFLENEDAN